MRSNREKERNAPLRGEWCLGSFTYMSPGERALGGGEESGMDEIYDLAIYTLLFFPSTIFCVYSNGGPTQLDG